MEVRDFSGKVADFSGVFRELSGRRGLPHDGGGHRDAAPLEILRTVTKNSHPIPSKDAAEASGTSTSVKVTFESWFPAGSKNTIDCKNAEAPPDSAPTPDVSAPISMLTICGTPKVKGTCAKVIQFPVLVPPNVMLADAPEPCSIRIPGQ